MRRQRLLWLVLGVLLALSLVVGVVLWFLPGSTSDTHAGPTASPTAVPSEAATTSPTAVELPADALVVITATARDSGGGSLALRLVMHRPVT